MALIHSQYFFDTVLDGLLQLIKSSNCIFHILHQNSKVHFHRKTIIICGYIVDDRLWFETRITGIVIILLQDILKNQYNDINLSTWLTPSTEVISELDAWKGARLKADTYALSLNVCLPPVVLARDGNDEFTSRGIQLYTPVNQAEILDNTPDLIIYTGS